LKIYCLLALCALICCLLLPCISTAFSAAACSHLCAFALSHTHRHTRTRTHRFHRLGEEQAKERAKETPTKGGATTAPASSLADVAMQHLKNVIGIFFVPIELFSHCLSSFRFLVLFFPTPSTFWTLTSISRSCDAQCRGLQA
jgi:hypothetical protein